MHPGTKVPNTPRDENVTQHRRKQRSLPTRRSINPPVVLVLSLLRSRFGVQTGGVLIPRVFR